MGGSWMRRLAVRPVLRSPNLVAAQPRLLLLFIRRAVAGRVTPARKLLEFPPAARPQVTVSPPALPGPPATPRVLDAAQRRSGRSESPASAHLACAACLIASSRACCRYLVSPMAPPGCSMVSGIFSPEPGPSLGQTRGGQPSYGCRHSRTGVHLFIVLLLLACHRGAEKL